MLYRYISELPFYGRPFFLPRSVPLNRVYCANDADKKLYIAWPRFQEEMFNVMTVIINLMIEMPNIITRHQNDYIYQIHSILFVIFRQIYRYCYVISLNIKWIDYYFPFFHLFIILIYLSILNIYLKCYLHKYYVFVQWIGITTILWI